jgi:fructose-1,6-bisphosphatase/inositol monophosphatase family enzyme
MGVKPWDVGAGGLLLREAGGGAIGRETALRESGTRYPVRAEISKGSLMALS